MSDLCERARAEVLSLALDVAARHPGLPEDFAASEALAIHHAAEMAASAARAGEYVSTYLEETERRSVLLRLLGET